MILKDLLSEIDEAKLIARTLFADRCELQDLYCWIIKYYAQLIELKNSEVQPSDLMMLLTFTEDDNEIYGDISGVDYTEIIASNEQIYAIEFFDCSEYASLYVPEYSIQCFGKEIVAAEALCEYGCNGFDETIKCPQEMFGKVIEALSDMEQEVTVTDKAYYEECKWEFCEAMRRK